MKYTQIARSEPKSMILNVEGHSRIYTMIYYIRYSSVLTNADIFQGKAQSRHLRKTNYGRAEVF